MWLTLVFSLWFRKTISDEDVDFIFTFLDNSLKIMPNVSQQLREETLYYVRRGFADRKLAVQEIEKEHGNSNT